MPPSRTSCNGLPDCDPPDKERAMFSIIASSGLILAEDYLVTKFVPESTRTLYSGGLPEALAPIIGSVVIATIFVLIYIEWARRPRPAPGRQKEGCCDERSTSNEKYTGPFRSTLSKGWIYGAAIGLLITAPNALLVYTPGGSVPFILGSAFTNIATYVIAGIIIAFLLHKPAKGNANCNE